MTLIPLETIAGTVAAGLGAVTSTLSKSLAVDIAADGNAFVVVIELTGEEGVVQGVHHSGSGNRSIVIGCLRKSIYLGIHFLVIEENRNHSKVS